MSGARQNIHGTALVVADKGVLLLGPSGSGKTMLALAMLQRASLEGRHCALIADDQLLLEVSGGRLLVHAPDTIAGLAEVYGLGPRKLDFRGVALIDLVAELGEGQRYQEVGKRTIESVTLPSLALPQRNARRSVDILAACLRLPPFAG